MAVTKIRRISQAAFLLAVAASLVVMGMFAFGGQVPEAQKYFPDLSQPIHLDLLLNWTYILVAITIVVLLFFAVIGFVKGLKESPKKAIGGFLALVALGALLVVTYSMGSGEILDILNYEGPHNVPHWLRIVDMWIYSIYAMVGVVVLAIIFTPLIAKMLK